MFSSSLTKQTWFWRRQLCRNSVHAVKDWLVTILTSQRSQQQRRHQDSVAFSRYLKLVFCFFRYLFLIFKNLQKFIFSKSKHFAKSFELVGKEPRLVLYSQTKGVKRGYILYIYTVYFTLKIWKTTKTMYTCNHSQEFSNVCDTSLLLPSLL